MINSNVHYGNYKICMQKSQMAMWSDSNTIEKVNGNIINAIKETATSLGMYKKEIEDAEHIAERAEWYDFECKILKTQVRASLRKCKKTNLKTLVKLNS